MFAPSLFAQADFLPIGDLPGDNFYSTIGGLSGDGSVAVGSSRGTGGLFAYRWTEASGMQVLPSLPTGPENSVAYDVSANGEVIIGTSMNASGNRAVRWTSAGIEELGNPAADAINVYATAISADGSTIAGFYTTIAGVEGFVWTEATGSFSIGDLPGGNLSGYPQCVSADGQWVGGQGSGPVGPQAFLWSAHTGLEALDPLPTGELPWRIIDLGIDGSKAYGSVLQNEKLVGFEWQRGLGGSLLPEPPLNEFTQAVAVDLSESVVCLNTHFFGFNEVYLLLGGGQPIRLEDHLFNLGVTNLGGLTPVWFTDISLDGTTLAGQAINANGKTEGWVARLEPGGPSPLGTSYCGGQATNSSGSAAAIQATGLSTAAVNSVTLEASQMPPGELGFFLNSLDQAFVPMAGGSAGNLCLGGQIGRYNASVFGTGSGAASLVLNLGATPTPLGFAAVDAGQTWNFQAWFRDTAAGAGVSNFTDGLSITFD